MTTIEIVVTSLFILGGIAIVITFIKDPKGAVLGVIAIPYGLLLYLWDIIKLIFIPIWGPIWLLDDYYGWGIFNWAKKAKDADDITYSGESRKINFKNFKKYIFTTEINNKSIVKELTEASETIPDLDISNYKISHQKNFKIIELPTVGLYGFGFIIQWFKNEFKNRETYGFATTSNLDFFAFQDPKTVNNIIGRTNENESFALSMYDDLDQDQVLTISDDIIVHSKLTTDFFKKLLNEHST